MICAHSHQEDQDKAKMEFHDFWVYKAAKTKAKEDGKKKVFGGIQDANKKMQDLIGLISNETVGVPFRCLDHFHSLDYTYTGPVFSYYDFSACY